MPQNNTSGYQPQKILPSRICDKASQMAGPDVNLNPTPTLTHTPHTGVLERN